MTIPIQNHQYNFPDMKLDHERICKYCHKKMSVERVNVVKNIDSYYRVGYRTPTYVPMQEEIYVEVLCRKCGFKESGVARTVHINPSSPTKIRVVGFLPMKEEISVNGKITEEENGKYFNPSRRKQYEYDREI